MDKFDGILTTVSVTDIIDIVLVAILVKILYSTMKNTRAMQLLKGMLVLVALAPIFKSLNLNTMYWVLSKAITVLILAIPVIFQPELRSALEKIGKRLPSTEHFESRRDAEEFINNIVYAIFEMAKSHTGALLIIQRMTALGDILERGVKIEGLVSADLLRNLFYKNSPLHDGAVVVCGNKVLAAGCYLPLSQRRLSSDLGTRHRAAVGMTEETDALAIVVSEENGKISFVEDGRLHRGVSETELRIALSNALLTKNKGWSGLILRRHKQK